MPIEQESQSYHFTLLFLSVKMKVKFPCKLSLEHGGNILTNQVSVKQQHKFVINEEAVIKDESEKKYVEIIVNLITEKGSKYIAGIVKLFHNELVRSEGQRVVVALGKCLDPEAFCEVKVEKVVTQKSTIKRNPLFTGSKVAGTRQNDNRQHSFSPAQNPNFPSNFKSATQLGNGFGTRSQAQFTTNNPLKPNRQWQEKRETCALTYYQRNKPSPPKTRRKVTDTSKVKFASPNSNLRIREDEQNTNREKLIEAEVYKQNYQKLKEKYRKQSENYKTQLSKRIALQNNENNYKLEIVRLRLKCEQLEKSHNDKSQRVRDLQSQLSHLHQKDIDNNYYKEELANYKKSLGSMEDTIITLNNENERLKELTKEREHEYETKMQQVQGEYERLKLMYEAKQAEYERDMRVMKEELIQVEYELNSKSESLQKQKNYIYQFQKTSQSKLFQFDTLLQNERNTSKAKYEQLKTRFQKLQLENKQTLQQKKQLEQQRQAHKSSLLKTEYEYKTHIQEINLLKNELEELHVVREKWQKLTVENRALREEKEQQGKNCEKLVKAKEAQAEEAILEGKKEVEFVKRVSSELGEKNKGLQERVAELEGMVEGLKLAVEKGKRVQETLTKEYTQLKEKEKTLKKTLTQKDQHIDELTTKLQKTTTKHTLLLQTKRLQSDKTTSLLSKLRLQLQSQTSKTHKLSQLNSQLSHEISRIKMLLQFSEEKLEKAQVSAQEKYKSYEGIIEEHEGVIAMLEGTVEQVKGKENQVFGRYSQVQGDLSLTKEQLDRQLKDNKLLQQKLSTLQTLTKQKTLQLTTLLTKHETQQTRNQTLEQELHQTKTQLSLTRGEKEKTLKLLEIANAQNEKNREAIVRLSGEVVEKEARVEGKGKEQAKLKEELEKTQYKCEVTAKEYAKFREAFAEVMAAAQRQFQTLKQETSVLVSNLNSGQQGQSEHIASFQQQRPQPYSMQSPIGNYTPSPNDWQQPLYPSSPTLHTQPRNRSSSSSPLQPSPSFTDIATFTTQILSHFSTYSQSNQSIITRLITNNKLLSKQLQSTKQQLSSQISLYQQLKYDSDKERDSIEEELRSITHQNGSQLIKLASLIEELKQQLYQKQQMLQEANSQLDELQFTLSSNKMDFDASLNQMDKKNYQLKQFLEEIEEKNEFQHNVISSLQQKCYQLDKEVIDLKNALVAEKEICYKREQEYDALNKELKGVEVMLIHEKQKANKLMQQVSNLQVELATEKENNQKLEKNLTQEEEKKKELKAFSAHIIKEKQTIIKQELEHHEKLSELENKLIETEHHKQLLLEEIDGLKTQIAQQKGEMKRLLQSMKEQEKQLQTERVKVSESQKLTKQKEKTIQQLQSRIKQLTKTHQQKQSQLKKSLTQLSEQLSYLTHHKQKLSEDMTQKAVMLQKQLRSYQTLTMQQKSQLQQLQQALYSYKEKCLQLQQTLTTLEHQLNEHRYRCQHLQSLKADLQQDCKDKEETTYQLSATIYQLQNRLTLYTKEKEAEIQQLNSEWTLKCEDLYQELQQRFELLEKEKQYLKEQVAEKEQEVGRVREQERERGLEGEAGRKLVEDKLRKMEEERLAMLTSKNLELQKQQEHVKQLLEANKRKQAETRKLSHQLQIARNQILKLDTRILELDQKIKSINKLYQQELEEMKKKEVGYKNFREEVVNQQWNTQREIRKVLQTFTKGLLMMGGSQESSSGNRDKTELMGMIKTLESGVLGAVRMFDEKV